MRIQHLVVSGFRAFSTRAELSLDADAILLIGGNGRGKTSLLDAVVWALLGRLPRLGDKQGEVVSKYGDGLAHVELTLRRLDEQTVVLRRSYDGERLRTVIEEAGKLQTDNAAESRLRQMLWPRPTADAASVIERIVTRSIYLQQDQIAHFVAADTDNERFDVISDLVGTTELTQLEEDLTRGRRAWSSKTNELAAGLEDAAQVVARLETLAVRLAPDDAPAVDRDQWKYWWQAVSELVPSAGAPPSIEAGGPVALDRVMAQISAEEVGYQRRVTALEALISALEAQPPPPRDDELRIAKQETATVASQLSAAQSALLDAQAAAAEERRRQVAAREAREELATLAELAHRHLSETCPVCGQAIDQNRTGQRLEGLIGEARTSVSPSDSGVVAAAQVVEQLEKRQAELTDLVTRLERGARAWADWRKHTARLAEEGGLQYSPAETLLARAKSQAVDCNRIALRLSSLRESGERLALALAATSQASRLQSTRNDLGLARSKRQELESEHRARERTAELASRTINALRVASSTLVRYQLAQLQPVAQAIYSRIDPHLSLRMVELNSRYSYGKGRVDTLVSDPSTDVRSAAPEAVLSSSQLNAYALSLFLAMNLGAPLPIEAVMLDDPLQSMDDVNLLGVADLLRRLRTHRQLLISTHERRLASLLERKLRPTDTTQRTLVMDFRDWTRQGPSIEVTPVPLDDQALQIVA